MMPALAMVATATVLVVDDEPTIREMVGEALASDGLRVVTAVDADEALTRFRAERPDLVLLDLLLPGMSGMEVCRILRRESAVPIIMLSARSSELDRVLGLEIGADDYVTKPFSLRELQARVRARLRRWEPGAADAPPSSVVHIGEVTVDLAGHRVLRDGRPLTIRPRVFELLGYLLRNRGQVFSREQLLEQVWGYEFGGETRTVEVHVHWLRDHLEPEPANPRYLETVRGTGYVLRLDE